MIKNVREIKKRDGFLLNIISQGDISKELVDDNEGRDETGRKEKMKREEKKILTNILFITSSLKRKFDGQIKSN